MVKTEAEAMREILDWSQDRPVWQRDALRRLISTTEALSDQDILELTELCKNTKLPNVSLASEHITAQKSGAPKVALKALRNVQNVNALAEKQSLTFIPKGVTIIYGDNGAGKSGYVRILKSACRARWKRGREDEILANIYGAPTGPKRAEIDFHAGAQVQKTDWTSDAAPAALLSEVSVFDTRTANVHVEETNDLAYTPFPMRLLERLVLACKGVKENLDREITDLKRQTPQSISAPKCSKGTQVGQIIASLSKDTTPDAVTAVATISDAEISRLAELHADFAQDPQVAARRMRAQKSRLQSLHDDLLDLFKSVSSENVENLKSLASDVKIKREAAALASQRLSQVEPLKGIGSETWRALWDAARAYSLQEAYKDKDFPVAEAAAHCVLCQQQLDQEAADRLRRFEDFVQDKTQKEEDEAQQALRVLSQKISSVQISITKVLEARRFLGDELGKHELSKQLRRAILLLLWRRRLALRSNGEEVVELASFDLSSVKAVMDTLESRAKAMLADDESEDRKALKAELSELQDRQWLAGIVDDVTAEIDRLKQVDELETALKDTRPGSITQKNTSLSETLITDRLRGRFLREIDHLRLAGLEIELAQARSQHGVSRFRVSLIESSSSNAGDILSEGEYRCVALAGFMAELATNDSGSGIIFDDPVSSLDHLHRKAIAQRLAEEGRTRQVVVFTHDLPFLFMLRSACTQVDDPAMRTDVALRHIQKKHRTPGHCRNEAPDRAQDAPSRLNTMRKHLENCRVQYENDPDSTEWLVTARGLVDSLRQTWETAIEDAVSPVLRTFSSKVDTKGFAKLSAISEADAITMRQHYGVCSDLLHKASDALNPMAPAPDDIDREFEALQTWLESLATRQKKIRAV
ncbi:AAA family ATPase [Pseudohalocynthiibacter aestuariivivens]|nr:AAA family ATPase [Pseudohalocynthiibacter aestuariivivens]QIE45821.1 AAA family ATPase [Pseudohalocynthiibacter aestuariivivens]